MELGRYRLLLPLGAGRDGVAYRAEAGGSRVEAHVLLGARDAPIRWHSVAAHLRRAQLIRHPLALKLHDVILNQSSPYTVSEDRSPEPIAAALVQTTPWPWLVVRDFLLAVCDVLLEAARLGVAPLSFGPASFRGTREDWRIELTGMRVLSELPLDGWHRLSSSCHPPEERSAGWQHDLTPLPSLTARMAANVYSLAAIFHWLLTHDTLVTAPPPPGIIPVDVNKLLEQMMLPDPLERPLLRDIRDQLAATSGSPEDLGKTRHGASAHPTSITAIPKELGRFRLLDRLGQGGMGAVYRAEDVSDPGVVAIKVLRPEFTNQADQLRRFQKEALVQAEVHHPHIVNLLEINSDHGFHYLVLEFVHGPNLSDVLSKRKRLTEAETLALMVPVTRGLSHVHQAGIVHRDIKPENILMQWKTPTEDENYPLAELDPKVSDFGLARHVVESESLSVTRPGTVLGTPWYMAPEQGLGQPVDARSDVYSLGATMFHALAGRPPFDGPTALVVLDMHRAEPVPSLQRLQPELSEAVCRIVEKSLAKDPADRYPDAASLLEELERLQQGEPTPPTDHPRRPQTASPKSLTFDFAWNLESPPGDLWPHVSNTDRLNRALGLPAVEWTWQKGAVRGKRMGRVQTFGMTIEWTEHPFEWIEGRRLGVLREFRSGPFTWLLSVVDLMPHGTGTRLQHRVSVEPAGLAGRLLAKFEIGWRMKRRFEEVYRRIDRCLVQAKQPTTNNLTADFFQPTESMSRAGKARLEEAIQKLLKHGIDPGVTEAIEQYIVSAAPQELAHIRPLALARRYELDRDQTLAACLHGVNAGLFMLLWDLLCPLCRQPADVRESLKALRSHGHCPACQSDFEVDLARSVELVCRVHPMVRESDTASYCIGGPSHAPHVVAQVRLAAGERLELDLNLREGSYRLQGPQLPTQWLLNVENGARLRRWEVNLSRPGSESGPVSLLPGGQRLILSHDQPWELLLRMERTAARDDALTAARASAMALFRELFPGEIVSIDQLLPVSTLTFVMTDVEQADSLYENQADAAAFQQVRGMMQTIADVVRREGGAVVKTMGEGALAVFDETLAAVRAGVRLRAETEPRMKVAVHCGPALVVTLNDQLDYFGATLHLLHQLPRMVGGGELLLTQSVLSDAAVSEWLQQQKLVGSVLEGGGLREVLYCYAPSGEDV